VRTLETVATFAVELGPSLVKQRTAEIVLIWASTAEAEATRRRGNAENFIFVLNRVCKVALLPGIVKLVLVDVQEPTLSYTHFHQHEKSRLFGPALRGCRGLRYGS
jgi:hypothetical protein